MDETIENTKAAITVKCLDEIGEQLEYLKKGEAVAGIYATLNADGDIQLGVIGLPIALGKAAAAVVLGVKKTLKGEV